MQSCWCLRCAELSVSVYGTILYLLTSITAQVPFKGMIVKDQRLLLGLGFLQVQLAIHKVLVPYPYILSQSMLLRIKHTCRVRPARVLPARVVRKPKY